MKHKQAHAELVEKMLTGARWATALRLTAQVFSWLSTIIVVRFISPEDYGLNSMLSSPLVLMLLLSTLGLEAALVQVSKISHEELQSIFGWLLILNGLLFLAYFFGGFLLAAYFKEPRLELLAKAMAVIFLLVPFRVIPNALLDRDLDFKLRAQLEITAAFLAAGVTLLLAYIGLGVWALVIGFIVSKLLLSILLMIFKPWFIVPKFSWSTTTKLLSVGGIVTFSSLIGLLSDQLVNLVAGPSLGATLLGIYGMSAVFASLPLAKGMPIINQTMLPAFAKFKGDREASTYYLEKLFGVISLAFIPMLVGLASVADILIFTVVGAKWAASVLPLEIFSLGMVFRMTTLQFTPVMISMGRADLPLKGSIIQLSVLFPLTVYAMSYGVIGLVLAWVVTEFIVMLAIVQMGKAVLNTNFARLLRCYRPALISSLVMAVCVIGVKLICYEHGGVLVLFLSILAGVISYYLATRLLFLKEFQTAFKTIFGNRFGFLAARSD